MLLLNSGFVDGVKSTRFLFVNAVNILLSSEVDDKTFKKLNRDYYNLKRLL